MNGKGTENVKVICELDSGLLKRIQALAEYEKRSFQDETAYLLEKGLSVSEAVDSQKNLCVAEN